jgi:PAS domain S-box-containing protein
MDDSQHDISHRFSARSLGLKRVDKSLAEPILAGYPAKPDCLDYRAIVLNSMDAIIAIDKEMQIVFWNAAAEAQFGFSAQEAGGTNLVDLMVPPDGRSQYENLLSHWQNTEEIAFWDQPVETVARDKAGRQFAVELFPTLLTIMPNDHILTLMFRAVAEPGEPKELPTHIMEAQSKYQRIVNSGIIGIAFWKIEGEIFEANDAFLAMLGYTRQDLQEGKLNWRAMTPPEYWEQDELAIQELLSTDICQTYEKQYFHKDGHRVDIQLGAACLEGTKEEGVSFFQDITARKTAEKELTYSLERETLRRHIGEITNQPFDIEVILGLVAQEVGRFFRVDRCIVTRYTESPDDPDKLNISVAGQYCASAHLEPVKMSNIPSDMLTHLAQHISHDLALKLINAPKPADYMREVQKWVSQLPLSETQKKEYTLFLQNLLKERYQLQSYLHLGILYKKKAYGAIILHQCYKQRVWKQTEIDLLYDISGHLGDALYLVDLRQHEQAAKRALERNYDLIHIISEAQNHFISRESTHTIFTNLLRKLLNHTNSRYGFIGEIRYEQNTEPDFLCNAEIQAEPIEKDYKPVLSHLKQSENILKKIISTRESLIINNPSPQQPAEQNEPQNRETPVANLAFNTFLGMPFFENGQLIGIVGLIDYPDGYNDVLVDELQPFLAACANIFIGARNEAHREQMTLALQSNETELKRYAEKLEKSNTELEQFATVASHDLQAPLRKVALFAEYLKASAGSHLSSESCDYIERIQKAIQKMQNLINDLLMLSRINRRGKPFRTFDVQKIIDDVLADLEEPIREAGAQLEVSGALTLDMDEGQIYQVFQNLLDNALKFRKKDGPLSIKIALKYLDDDMGQLIVEDNGIGFDEKYLDRIFRIFERLHGEQEYPGTGMGLAIVQKIVERHNGSITARSRPNQGARFIVTLPIHQP